MNKRYKIKKWFKDHFTKDKIMPWVLTGIIMLLVLLCVYFENKDKKQMESKTSDISLVETAENLNKSWTINQDGNLVGSNLLNFSIVDNSQYIGNYYVNNDFSLFSNNDYYCFRILVETTTTYYLNRIPNVIIRFEDTSFYNVGGTLSLYSLGYGAFQTTYNTKYVVFSIPIDYTNNIMLNKGSTALPWEPYGVWYSNTNYTQYGVNEYIKGLADNENQYYYFDNRSIKYYTSNNELIATQNLTQNTYNNYSIDSIDYVEQYIIDNGGNNYYGIIDNLNILSKEFFVNINYSSPVYQGYVTIHYSNDTTYSVEPYDYNQNYYIYNGAETNADLFISKIEIGFHYDDATAIVINTSPNVVLYQNGYNEGYKIGYNESSETFYQNGRKNGYNEGYQIGLNEGAQKDLYNNGMRTLFDSILSFPVNMLSSVFNFEFMGINIASTIFFLISCGIVLWIIKRLWK